MVIYMVYYEKFVHWHCAGIMLLLFVWCDTVRLYPNALSLFHLSYETIQWFMQEICNPALVRIQESYLSLVIALFQHNYF